MSNTIKDAIYPEQCRAARGLLGWSQTDLEAASHVHLKTIADFERLARQPHQRTLKDLQAALERAGVVFTDRDIDGPGVRASASYQFFLDLQNLTRRGDLVGVRAAGALVLVQAYGDGLQKKYSGLPDAQDRLTEEWLRLKNAIATAAAACTDEEYAEILHAAGEAVSDRVMRIAKSMG